MENFAAMNRVYDTFFEHPKPVLNPPRPLVAFLAKWLTPTLTIGTDVCRGQGIAHEDGCRDRVCGAFVSESCSDVRRMEGPVGAFFFRFAGCGMLEE